MPLSTHQTDIQVRFGDTDALGHINNASFASYAETARLNFLESAGTSVRSLILANLSIDFRRQVSFDEAVRIETWIEKLGTSSVTIVHTIYAADQRAADVRSVVVYFDYDTNRPRPLGDELRMRLAQFVSQE